MLGVGGAGLLALIVKAVLDANDLRSTLQDFAAGARTARDEAEGKRPPE